MDRHHPTDLLPALALDCLDAEEAAAVRVHLDGCAACRAELQALEETSALLLHAVPPAEPPAALRERLLASLPRRRGYAWFDRLLAAWPRLVPAVAVAAVVLAITLGAANLILLQSRLSAPGNPLEAVQLVRLQATPAMPAASGVLLVDPGQATGVLVVTALAALDPALQYQLWLVKDGRRTSGGTFSVAADGSARLTVSSPQPLAAYDAFGITIEPYGGSPGPTGAKVLGGRLATQS